MGDTAIPRVPGSNPEADAWMAAVEQWRRTGVVPPGYSLSQDGSTIYKSAGNDGGFLNKHGWELMAAILGGGTAAGMALGPAGASAAGTLPSTSYAGSASLPAAGAGNLAHVATGAATGTAAKTGTGLFSGFGVKDAVQLAPLAASLLTTPAGNGHAPQEDAMTNLINLQTDRLHASNPLYQAILSMAMHLMPTAYQGGTGLPGAPTTTAPLPSPSIPRRR